MTKVKINPRLALREALYKLGDAEAAGVGVPRARGDVTRAAWQLLAWMENNGVDPGNPPTCACGGEHWTCDYRVHD